MISGLNTILAPDGLRAFCQPIIRVSALGCALHSIECLSRGPEKTPWEDPTVLFDYARRKGAEAVVDLHAIQAAFSACEQVRPDLGFSVNVHASTLSRQADFVPRLVEHAVRSHIDLARLTVEIVEHSP